MKICILVNDITSIGGVERVVALTANKFIQTMGWEVDIISVFKKNNTNIFFDLDKKVNVIYIDQMYEKKRNKFKNYISIYNLITEIYLENNYKNILGCSISLNLISLLSLKVNKCKSKIYAWEHSQYNNVNKLFKLIRRVFYSKLNGVITLTENDKKIFLKYCKNTIKINNIKSFETKEVNLLNSLKIIAVGRLEHEKGFDMLIKAFNIVNKKNSNVELEIYGEGSQQDNLKNLIEQYKLSKVIKIKPFNSSIKDKYLKASIMVVSSRSESFGMVIIEAMTCGLPVVSFNCKVGPREIIDDKINGYLCEENNFEELAEKILILCNNRQIREEMGKKAKKKSDLYNSKNILEEWEKYLNDRG